MATKKELIAWVPAMFDESKGLYAIEMEVSIEHKEIVKKYLEKKWYTYYNSSALDMQQWEYRINNEWHMWIIVEFNIFEKDFDKKSKVYMDVAKLTKNYTTYPIWSDWRLSWGNHCHIFLKREYFDLIYKNQELQMYVLETILSIPIRSKRIKKWFIHRNRSYDLTSLLSIYTRKWMPIDSKGWIITLQPSYRSIEIRVNEYIHPIVGIIYMYLIKKAFHDFFSHQSPCWISENINFLISNRDTYDPYKKKTAVVNKNMVNKLHISNSEQYCLHTNSIIYKKCYKKYILDRYKNVEKAFWIPLTIPLFTS